ncbi:MAG: YbjN domain-containing protein [Alphaproteobacteria bacterium]
MMTEPHDLPFDDPIDDLVDIAEAEGWPVERINDCELRVQIKAGWGVYEVSLIWFEAVNCLAMAAAMDVDLTRADDPTISELLRGINERMWIGHFDLFAEQARPVFRNSLLLAGTEGATTAQLNAFIDHGIEESERMYPAFVGVAHRGVTVESALSHAMLETVGEA